MEKITLGGGCFWCVEAVFNKVIGIQSAESGYAQGHLPNPTYEQVCSGQTGHVEVVQLTFDEQNISLKALLEIFFTIHNPTTANRQGDDVGTQYRSGIYTHKAEQTLIAADVMLEVAEHWDEPIVTELQPLTNYYRAEDYHQNYFEQHPHQGYCAAVIAPKIEKFYKTYRALLKT